MPGEQALNIPSLGISAGKVRQAATQDTPGAVYREWEIAGEKKGRWELVFSQWTGVIQSMSVRDSQYGQQLSLKFNDAYISVSTKSRYFTDLVTKLKNINQEQPVTLKPFDFLDDNGKRREGVTIIQNDTKIESAYKKKGDDGKWVMTNGYPETTGKEKTSNQWKSYFLQVEDFLIDEVNKKPYEPTKSEIKAVLDGAENEFNITDVPF